MNLENAFETGRLYKPLRDLADAKRDIHSAFTLLPGLRGFWPMSATNENGAAIDQSGHNQILVTNGTPVYNFANVPYVDLNGTTDYLSHFDTALYDILGTESYIDPSLRGLTCGGWIRPNVTGVSNAGLLSKYGTAGNRSYLLLILNDKVSMLVSSNGTAQNTKTHDLALSTGWYFVVGRYVPSTTVDVFVNGDKASLASGVSASAYNGSAELQIGTHTNTYLFDGRMSLMFLTATALPDSILDNLYQTSRSLFGV